MVLKIIQDFEPKFTGTLDKLQGKKFFFERLGTITIILEQLKALQSNMANLMWKLVKALPVCDSPRIDSIPIDSAGRCLILLGPISRRRQ